jgi:hypothetical protein
MSLQDMLGRILSEYGTARSEPLRNHPVAKFIRETAADEVREALGDANRDGGTALWRLRGMSLWSGCGTYRTCSDIFYGSAPDMSSGTAPRYAIHLRKSTWAGGERPWQELQQPRLDLRPAKGTGMSRRRLPTARNVNPIRSRSVDTRGRPRTLGS